MLTTFTRARFVALPGVSPSQTPKKGMLATFNTLIAAQKSRTALAKLDQRGLDDVGLTARDVAKELAKPVWDVPSKWWR